MYPLAPVDRLKPHSRLSFGENITDRQTGKPAPITPAKWFGCDVAVHCQMADGNYLISVMNPNPAFPLSEELVKRGERRQVSESQLTFLDVEATDDNGIKLPPSENAATSARLDAQDAAISGIQNDVKSILAALTKPT